MANLPEPAAGGYAELCVTSNFTFLTGASHPEELVLRAAELGLQAIAITDRNSLAGVVRAHVALRELRRQLAEQAQEQLPGEGLAAPSPPGHDAGTVRNPPENTMRADVRSRRRVDPSSRQDMGHQNMAPQDMGCQDQHAPEVEGTQDRKQTTARPAAGPALPKLITGSRLVLQECPVEFVALPVNKPAYARLSRLLTLGKRRAVKGACTLYPADLMEWGRGLILIALPPDLLSARPEMAQEVKSVLNRLVQHFPGHVYTGAAPGYDGQDQARFDALYRLSLATAAPLVAVGDVLMHRAGRRALADVLTCLREGCTIATLGRRAMPNGERRLKDGAGMARLFARYPAALRRTLEIAARCAFSLDDLSYQYPEEVSGGEDAQGRLERLVRAGLESRERFPGGPDADTLSKVERELVLIRLKAYAPYFLTVHDIVQFARSRNILCQGRGSAANSIVCYALGITEVKPGTTLMVFERFISAERGEPPDIDVDFEHERREEVIQHIYERYGRHRTGLTATVIHFRSRAAIREVGKVMGLSQDVLAAIAGQSWGWSNGPPDPARLREIGLDPSERRLAMTLELIAEIIGFPRHLSQHVGGFVITRDRLDELCPIENAAMEGRTVIEWDKDDIDALGILKVDVLALGMLTCLRKGFDLLVQHERQALTLASVPEGDAAVYDMLCRADAIGVFQVESRAQMNFLPRMRPRDFYDLVIEVAIVRPGPIQGGMVHPYINRRRGKEKVDYPSDALKGVLGKTLGVPLFQEQALQIAVVAAGFTPGEADRLRRSLATFKRMGTIHTFRGKFISGMLGNGYSPEFAERCFSQIEGFGEYGFPESHAASFARLVYISAWMKCHHPAIFACALLNAQPMGFYAPAQIVRDAREHGVEVRPVSVNHSAWDNTLERRSDGALALRLGFRQIKGLREADCQAIAASRGNGYPDVETIWQRTRLKGDVLQRLAEGDALTCLGLTRRTALWQVKALGQARTLPLFSGMDGEAIAEPEVALPSMSLGEEVVEDYVALRLSLRAHPMELLRPALPGLTAHDQLTRPDLRQVSVAGLVITRQRPGTASGVIFLTLEDETGVSNVVVWPKVYEAFRRAVIGGRLLRVTGRLQREGQVVHLIAGQIEDLSHILPGLGQFGGEIDATGGTPAAPGGADLRGGKPSARHPREQAKLLFRSRDFH
ncbi:error-prone DNA polymerase [Pannonibacter phragmitetus]|uniref:Error-prone DNA polymerase n=1 Tax=Pannonibacter phragmitetus TaxID=121719 RepID=A0A0U3PDB0_9HYPH|nr:error-prone DNA polymerase [Pannonibacter phragmitetus]ALV26899.1 DNA polymerase [Pannonibacter phragmitetus]